MNSNNFSTLKSKLKISFIILVLFMNMGFKSLSELKSDDKIDTFENPVLLKVLKKSIKEPIGRYHKPYKISVSKKIFKKGTKISQAYSSEVLLACENKSWLFFIDEFPDAYFKHPVKIGIFDLVTKKIKIKDAEWWPVVDGISYFIDSSEKKEKDKYLTCITYYDDIKEIRKRKISNKCNCSAANPTPKIPRDYKNVIGERLKNSYKKLWAIIILGAIEINGHNKGLAYDANGMYSILKAYNVPEERIYYFKKKVAQSSFPLPFDDMIYKKEFDFNTILEVLENIKKEIKPDEKFLFFISAHGGFQELDICKNLKFKYTIDDNQMQKWFSEIKCSCLFIIINSCRSGSFISGRPSQCCLNDLSVQNPNEENNFRIVITSSSSNEYSYPDIDTCDCNYRTDQGSEFIGGFFEAFTKKEADIDCNNRISIGEAFDYAKKYAACGGGSLTCKQYIPKYTPIIKWSSSYKKRTSFSPYTEYLF